MYTKQVLKQMHTGEPAVNNFGAQAGKKKWIMAYNKCNMKLEGKIGRNIFKDNKYN